MKTASPDSVRVQASTYCGRTVQLLIGRYSPRNTLVSVVQSGHTLEPSSSAAQQPANVYFVWPTL